MFIVRNQLWREFRRTVEDRAPETSLAIAPQAWDIARSNLYHRTEVWPRPSARPGQRQGSVCTSVKWFRARRGFKGMCSISTTNTIEIHMLSTCFSCEQVSMKVLGNGKYLQKNGRLRNVYKHLLRSATSNCFRPSDWVTKVNGYPSFDQCPKLFTILPPLATDIENLFSVFLLHPP